MTQFEIGQHYGLMADGKSIGLVVVIRRTAKFVRMFRYADYGYGGDHYTADSANEHRYKVYTDSDGDEYTIIDRFTNMRGEVWGTIISSNPAKADEIRMLSNGPHLYDGPAPIWQEHA